ncbi:MAG: FAD:protein FMN transferase [Candidatus Saccharicenans sp.]|nr:FAD:protein FMN transferase [Candidatus Saccharicenans sp.]
MPEKKAFNFSHQAMGTFFEVFVANQAEEYSRSAARAFFREVDRLEGFLSRFDPGSEISRINRLKPGEILPVGLETFECLKLSFQLMVETGGAFNVNFRAAKKLKEKKEGKPVRPLARSVAAERRKRDQELKEKILKKEVLEKFGVEVEGRSPGSDVFATGTKSAEESSGPVVLNQEFFISMFPLEIVEQGGGYAAVRLEVPGTALDLDLGAIGKGYALEKAGRIFSDWEIDDFLVSAGGSTVYSRGAKPWPVAVGGGFDFFRPGKILLNDRALSGSGHEVKGEHIFDPRRRVECSRHLAVWVSHPSPAASDALSTAFMVMNLKEIRAYAKTHPEVWALVFSRNKKSHLFDEMDFFKAGD